MSNNTNKQLIGCKITHRVHYTGQKISQTAIAPLRKRKDGGHILWMIAKPSKASRNKTIYHSLLG